MENGFKNGITEDMVNQVINQIERKLSYTIIHGNNLEILDGMDESSIDAIVTDPPYGLKFMGKKWDYQVPSVLFWEKAYRVLKPGGHVLCACGTRTQHRMAVNIEDGGFEIRDVICWHYGSGFPKSLDVSKALDERLGAKRDKKTYESKPGMAQSWDTGTGKGFNGANSVVNEPITDAAKQYDGWGTALKPATEFWTLARKPLIGTVAENVLQYGTGGLNIDGCRIGTEEVISQAKNRGESFTSVGNGQGFHGKEETTNIGRFPSNVIFDEFMAAELDKQSGELTSGSSKSTYIRHESENRSMSGKNYERPMPDRQGNTGGASRFFYVAKPDTGERNRGTRQLKQVDAGSYQFREDDSLDGKRTAAKGNFHPTVKPVDLMRYLIRLITPKDGIVLDPFNGSGTTGMAAKLEFMNYIGIEREKEYCEISEARIAAIIPQTKLFNEIPVINKPSEIISQPKLF